MFAYGTARVNLVNRRTQTSKLGSLLLVLPPCVTYLFEEGKVGGMSVVHIMPSFFISTANWKR